MYKIVLDSNIFISAVLKKQSNPGHILDLIKEENLILVLSRDILSEIEAVLSYPKIKKIHGLTPKGIQFHLKCLESRKILRIIFIWSALFSARPILLSAGITTLRTLKPLKRSGL